MKLVLSTAVAVLSATVFAPAMRVVSTSGGAQWEGPFEQRWSLPVAGELAGLEMAADRVYAVTLNGSMLEVASFELDDGSVLWERSLTDAAWSEPEYWGSSTEYGLLLTYGADEGGHLTLLDADSGETRWDEGLRRPAYDVYEQVNDHIALFELSEGDLQFIDLDTTAQADAGEYFSNGWVVIGDELGRFEDDGLTKSVPESVVEESIGEVVADTTSWVDDSTDPGSTPVAGEPRSLEVGWDPFDPEAPTTAIELPGGTDDVGATDDGRLVVATVGHELVGVLDGQEVWRWTPDVVGIGYIEFIDGLIGVVELSGGTYTGRAQFARLDENRLEPFDIVPPNFRVDDVALDADGSVAAVGVFDTTGGSSTEEMVTPAIVELEHGNAVREFPSQINGEAYVGAFGEYVFTASPYGDEQLVIYRRDSLQPLTSIPYPEENSVVDVGDGIIVYDAASSTISAYA